MSSVHYKFKSGNYHKTLSFDGNSISVGQFKQQISKGLARKFRRIPDDIIITNAQTNQEYLDEGIWIPKNTSLVIQRIPGHPRKPIIVERVTDQQMSIVETSSDGSVDGSTGSATSVVTFDDELDLDDFGSDPFAIPEPVSLRSSIPPPANTPLIETNTAGRDFGQAGFEKKLTPEGYICHRCKIPGHLIQHCPTNGDPTFDIKRFKPAISVGSYEAENLMMPSTRSVAVLPPELHCPVCKEVMKYAVLTSKCCFNSFCDKCIRDHTISKSMCVCGATDILADDLLPNKTLRDTINRYLESGYSGDEYVERGSRSIQVQDMESHDPQAKVPSSTQSAPSNGQKVAAQSSQREESCKISEHVSKEKGRTLQVPDASEVTPESRVVREPVSQNSILVEREVQQIPISGETAADAKSPCRIGQDLAQKNYTKMNMGPAALGPFWNGMQQPGFNGYMHPLYPGQMPPYSTGYGTNPMGVYRGMLPPQYAFGATGPMMPYGVPVMSRVQSEARRCDLKRKRERGFPELSKRSKQCC